MKVPRCKGTRDLLPADMAKFRYIEGLFRSSCLKWGYEEVRTPTLEYLHLFTSAGTLTSEMLNRVYSFLDWDGWSGQRVVLRPDGTIPIARLYADCFQENTPAKLFYVENMFAFEGTGQESRERWVCGAELIGNAGYKGDVELILLAIEVINMLGINGIDIKLSHAGLIKTLLKEIGSNELLEQVLGGNHDALSKVENKNPELAKQLGLLFGLNGKTEGFLENLRSIFPELESAFDDLANVTRLLSALNCKYRVHLASGLGFEYYTGTIFQMFSKGQKLGGGGRYDELIPLVGDGQVPASGIALYVDHIMDIIDVTNVEIQSCQKVMIKCISPENTDSVKSCFDLACSLRSAGFIVDLCSEQQVVSEFGWVVEDVGGAFNLIDTVSGKTYDRLSRSDIQKKLGECTCSLS